MKESLGSLHFNENGGLILSSSYLSYQHWKGYIGLLTPVETDELIKSAKPFNLCNFKVGRCIESGVNQARWISNERFILGTDNGEIMMYTNINDQKSQEVMIKQEHDSMVLSLATNMNSEIALSGSDDSKIKVWDLNDEVSIKTLKGHDSAVCSLTFKPTCTKTFLSCSEDNRALMWDTRNLEKPAYRIPHNFNGFPSASAWSKLDTNLFALGSETGQLCVFDVRNIRSNESVASVKSNSSLIRSVGFNVSSNLIATASEDCRTLVYKLTHETTLEEIYENSEHSDYITDLAWHPQNSSEHLTSEYLTISWDGTIKKHLVKTN